jgi:hypothetical protein
MLTKTAGRVVAETGSDQSKDGSADQIHYATVQNTFIAYIVLVLQSLALNPIFMFERVNYLVVSDRWIVNSTWKQNRWLRSFTVYYLSYIGLKKNPNSNNTGHKPWEFVTIVLILFPSRFQQAFKYYD